VPTSGKRRRKAPAVEADLEAADPVQAIVDRIMDHPRTQNVLGVFDQVGVAIDRMSKRPVAGGRADADSFRLQHRCLELERELRAAKRLIHKLRQNLTARRDDDPRSVLLFPKGARPTAAEVKKRRNALAAIAHPDRGGDTAVMQRINRAADQLAAEAGR